MLEKRHKAKPQVRAPDDMHRHFRFSPLIFAALNQKASDLRFRQTVIAQTKSVFGPSFDEWSLAVCLPEVSLISWAS